MGAIIAYRKTSEITEPLNRLILVAEKIGQSGELDHTIDVHGKDEIAQLARTFDSMVKYLKEMAAVSEAIAGGNLAVEVHPALRQRHSGQRLHAHGGRAARPGAQWTRRSLAGGERSHASREFLR